MVAFGACFSWIWSSWGLNTVTGILETSVLHMALSKGPKFHVPCCGMSPQCSLQGFHTSGAIRVAELFQSRDVLGAGLQSIPYGLWWTWKVWAPPSLKSICFHRTFIFLLVGVFSWKTPPWKSLSQRWHGAHRSAFTFPVFQEHLCTYQLKISPDF